MQILQVAQDHLRPVGVHVVQHQVTLVVPQDVFDLAQMVPVLPVRVPALVGDELALLEQLPERQLGVHGFVLDVLAEFAFALWDGSEGKLWLRFRRSVWAQMARFV